MPVYAAANVKIVPRTSSNNPGVTIVAGVNGGKIGYVNITNTMFLNSFNTSATTGTITLDVRGLEHQEPSSTLYLMTRTYGNGTLPMKIVVLSNLVPTLQGGGWVSAGTSSIVTTIGYSVVANQQSQLLVIFAAFSATYLVAAFVLASIMGVLLILLFIRPGLNILGGEREGHRYTGAQTSKDMKDRTMIAIILLAITVVIALLAIVISGFGG